MTIKQPTFRPASLNDISQLIDLRIAMQLEVHHGPEFEDLSKYREVVRGYLEENLISGGIVCLVAEYEGRLIAMAGLIIYRKIPSLGSKSAGKIGYVSSVYTLPEWRRRGVAGVLMRALIDSARSKGIEKLHLGATPSGKGVYERAGFHAPKHLPLEYRLASLEREI